MTGEPPRIFDESRQNDSAVKEREDRVLRGIRAVREGHGANCSSIGSVVDTLFASAVIGGALFAAIASSIARQTDIRVVGQSQPPAAPSDIPGAPAPPTDPPAPR
jgi:hypothetical protein